MEGLRMTEAYNANSLPQLQIIQHSVRIIQQGIDSLNLVESAFPIIIADFGAAHGSNALCAMKTIIDYVKRTKNTSRSFLVIYNDLPANNWNSVFDILNKDKTHFGLGNGRSFYEQCLPTDSLTVGYSANAIHWLSRKPCNISNHCFYCFAQGEEFDAFKAQAKQDYEDFLKARSMELIQGGILIMIVGIVHEQSKSTVDDAFSVLYNCAKSLPLTDEELLNYTVPLYFRSHEECIDNELFSQYSLELIDSSFYCKESSFYEEYANGGITVDRFAEIYTNFLRAPFEFALKQALEISRKRSNEDINQLLDQYWSLFCEQVKNRPHAFKMALSDLYLVFKKI